MEESLRNPALVRQLPQIRQRIESWKEQLKGTGNRIKRLRLYQDPKSVLGTSVTMRDIGNILNVRYQNIPYMEKFPNDNFNGLTLEKAVEVAATFKVSLDYLLLGIDIVKVHKSASDDPIKAQPKQNPEKLNQILMDYINLKEENEELKKEIEILRENVDSGQR